MKLSKRIFTFFLTVIMVFSSLTIAVGDTTPFTDVDASHWAYEAITDTVETGLFSGTSGTTFSPETPMTRAMFVTVLARLEGGIGIGSTSFRDVPDGAWYASAVDWAQENRIVSGITDSTFAPEGNVTREQMAAILFRYINYKDMDVTVSQGISFADEGSISPYALEAVKACQSLGLINGMGGNRFEPQSSFTRAQGAVVFSKLSDLVNSQTAPEEPEAERETYTVTFNTGGGSSINSAEVLEGGTLTRPSNPTRSGYSFEGWYTDSAFTNRFEFTTPITGNITLYAKWTSTIIGSSGGGSSSGDKGTTTTYAVTYNANGGEGSHTVSNLISGSSHTVLDETETGITREAYEFISWNTAADGTGTTYLAGESFNITANVTLYAQWKTPDVFKVSYDPNGGTDAPVDNNEYTSGETAIVLAGAVPPVDEMSFKGWNTNRDGSGDFYQEDDSIVVTGNITLYAIYTGDGTAEYPYMIYTPEDLDNVRNDLEGCYQLGSDIDMTGWDWVPLGDEVNGPFLGEFDGGGYTIHNLTVTSAVDASGQYSAGLFGYLYDSKVENLTLENVTIDAEHSESLFVGAFTGTLVDTDIINCHIKGGLIQGTSAANTVSVGGFVGYHTTDKKSSAITNCSVDGDIKANGSTGNIDAGGIAGNNFGVVIENCYAQGTVYAQRLGDAINGTKFLSAGGIAGHNVYGTITNCYAVNTVTAETAFNGSTNAGGIAGVHNSGTVEYCYAAGEITANGVTEVSAGGITGSSSAKLTDCVALNNKISATGETDIRAGRICATANLNLNRNYGKDTMSVNGTDPLTPDMTGIHGASISESMYSNQSWWNDDNTTGFWKDVWGGTDDAPWVWDENTSLPRLYWQEPGEIPTYTVTYDANGGEGSFTSAGLPLGSSYTILDGTDTGITRDGYYLAGWEDYDKSYFYYIDESILVTGDLALYARWDNTLDIKVVEEVNQDFRIIEHVRIVASGINGYKDNNTDAEGLASFSLSPNVTYTITATKDGYWDSVLENISVPAQGNKQTLQLIMYKKATVEPIADPTTQTATPGDTYPLTVTASSNNSSGQLSYQWYSKDTGDNDFTAIQGATGSTYEAPIDTVGETDYYVAVTETVSGHVLPALDSNVVRLEVVSPANPDEYRLEFRFYADEGKEIPFTTEIIFSSNELTSGAENFITGGAYTFENLAPGTFDYTVQADGMVTVRDSVVLSGNQTVDVVLLPDINP